MLKPAILYINLCRFCFLLCLILFTHLAKTQPPKGNYIAENLSDNWQIYDQNTHVYIPFLTNIHSNYQSINQHLYLPAIKNYSLLLNVPSNTYLFYNNNFELKLNEGWNKIVLNKLISQNPQLVFTIYNEKAFTVLPEIYLCHQQNIAFSNIKKANIQFPIKPRNFNIFHDFLILFSIFLLISVVIVFNIQENLLQRYINLKDLFTFKKRLDPSVSQGPFLISNFFYIIILSFFIAMVIILADNYFGNIIPKYLLVDNAESFSELSIQFFNISFLIILGFIFKYFFINSVGNLFKLNKITNLHFFKNIQSLGVITLFGFIVLLAINFADILGIIYPTNYFIWAVGVFFILRSIILFFVLNRVIIANNLYLFSYLCIVEIIPAILGLRLVL